jgi:ABC-type antimicrobial peptide transport system permease subunit
MIRPIEAQLRHVTGLPVSNIHTMEAIVTLSTSRERFNMLLMTVFGSAALLLAAIGIYGLMAYAVQQRSQEMGVRLALGAGPARLRNMVVWQGMRVALLGVVVGMAAAMGLTRLLTAFLFGVTARDPIAFVVVTLVLIVAAFMGVWLPARRAARVDPMVALRAD